MGVCRIVMWDGSGPRHGLKMALLFAFLEAETHGIPPPSAMAHGLARTGRGTNPGFAGSRWEFHDWPHYVITYTYIIVLTIVSHDSATINGLRLAVSAHGFALRPPR